ncbi:MAG: DEAD/DEAH box helicase family protein [Candidatus Micrarchaeota archaeon]
MLDLSLLKKGKFELRDYQISAAEKLFSEKRLLVVMPTALGKTFIAVLAIAHLLKTSPKKILFLAPTKPLVLQQAKRLEEFLETIEEAVVMTGEVAKEERAEKYAQATVVFATPQTIRNDLKSGLLSLQDFSLVVFDEAHRAVGAYAYVFIGEKAQKTQALVLGLTASPSAERKKVAEVCRNLGVNAVEVKTAQDEQVQKFVKEVKVFWEFVDLPPELVSLRKKLEELLSEPLSKLAHHGFVSSKTRANKKELLALRTRFIILAKTNPAFYSFSSFLAKALNLVHAIDLLESEGVKPLLDFLESLNERETKTKAVLQLLKDPRVEKIKAECRMLLEKKIEHPKLHKLTALIAGVCASGKSAIVFAHYRDSVAYLILELNALPKVNAKALVGRAGGGMNQKEQHAVVESFRNGEFNVLVATSIGEEGLDIPGVDLVVFYEAVPSEIRLIQRRGRAGRAKVGEVVVLVTRGTKDEAYLWISKNKEKKMLKQMERMQHVPRQSKEGETLPDEGTREETKKKGQTSLGDF